ncbi:MAG: sulfatase [Candidatus Aminicenantes bacterium]|nr:sulfatase [Candidatus Aminicenantes bacterium]
MKKRQTAFLFIFILVSAMMLNFICCTSRLKKLNIILVSIDTLRPDHLGCYGYEKATSPTIDRLAKEGVCFKSAFSSTTWTLPAHLAMLTSLPDLVHGVVSEAFLLDEKRITLAEMLKKEGYKTYGVFTGPFLLPRWGFNQGFDKYIDATLYDKALEGAEMLNAAERGRTTPGAMEEVKTILETNKNHPFFLFLHLFDVHPDFDPPPPYDTLFDPDYSGDISGKDIMNNPKVNKDIPARDLEHLQALYDGEIRFVDEQGITRLIELLSDNKLLDNTLLVITSDHGEEFFEHGVFGHRQNLFDTTLRIPLIFWCPQLFAGGRIVDQQVRIIDIMPTILDLVGAPQSPEGLGKSLVSLIKGSKQDKFSASLFAEVQSTSWYLETLRTENFKFIRDYKQQNRYYYNLEQDRLELDPLTDQEDPSFMSAQEQYLSLRFALVSYKEKLPWNDSNKSPEMDAELRERLRSLGYIK